MRRMLCWLCVVLPVILAVGCSQKTNPLAPNQAPSSGQLLFALDAADNIASGKVTISKGSLIHVLPIAITSHTGSVTFNGIQVGRWHIQVQLFDEDGEEIYSGEGEALVRKNQTTTVNIQVNQNTGTLVIHVLVPFQLMIEHYTTTPRGNSKIYGIQDDGTGLTLIGPPDDEAQGFRFITFCGLSRQGNWILFLSESRQLYTMNPNGADIQGIALSQPIDWARWSWNGSQVAAGTSLPTYDILVANADGSNELNLTQGSEKNTYPCWTPDGRIVFTRDDKVIHVINADGSNQQLVIDLTQVPGFPPYLDRVRTTDCSSDNTLFLTVQFAGPVGYWKLYTVKLDGSGLTSLMPSSMFDSDAHLNPDEQRIIYSHWITGQWEYRIANRDGSGAVSIPNTLSQNSNAFFMY